MIEASGLTKQYGDKVAVNDLSFSIKPGQVTGFLGPNGAGKSTTMRMILGLDAPTSGRVTIAGRPFAETAHPMRQVGALLDAKAIHGGRSARSHLVCLAQTDNLPRRRVDEVLAMVGLTEVARKRSKGFSLGMGQRLGIAAALLGDPQVLMFDEPVNGLDPEGILWIRDLMKQLAAEGRTVFVSSHLMSEMENTADHLLVIGRGQLHADCTVEEFIERNSELSIRVRTPDAANLAVFCLVISEALSFAAFFIGNAVISPAGYTFSLSNSADLVAVFGAGLYLTGCALPAFGLGAFFRDTAAGIAVPLALLFGLEIIGGLMPQEVQDALLRHTPLEAGIQMLSTIHPPGHDLSAGHGFEVFFAWVLAAVLAGFQAFTRRDA